jgi:hypothetical protein|tara:strand:- start:461 stop:730 length:270 start_codon:yes stop_codon:yes gene_type:complete
MSNFFNSRYILQETRELAQDEFVFTREEDVGGRSEAARRLWKYLEDNFHIARVRIPERNLPSDNGGRTMTGFKIIDVREHSNWKPYDGS